MARDWSDTEGVRTDILQRMAEHGPNIAPVPFTETIENRGGILTWVVDLHVKVRRTTEFDVSAEAETLSEALRRAYLSLAREPVRSH